MALSPGRNPSSADIVYTPLNLAQEIIEHFIGDETTGSILDPCRGGGAFYDNFPNHLTKEWCEVEQGRDFLTYLGKHDWIITNPPWSKMRDFIQHGCLVADRVVYLSTLTHFVTKARLRDLKQLGFGLREFYCVPTPKKDWPASGFQLGAMLIERGYEGGLDISGHVGK